MVTTGAIGPSGPSTCVRRPHAWACSASGCGLTLSTSTQGSMLQVVGSLFFQCWACLIMTCDLREIPFPFPQRMLCKKLPRKWRIVRMLRSRRKLLKNEDSKNFACSMIKNREQWVYSSPILSSYDMTTFLSKHLLPGVVQSLAAKWECREIHERRWVFLETFLIVNMLNEILIIYTMIQEIWRHYWRFWEYELRKMEAKNRCNQYFYLAFQLERGEEKSGRQISLVSMTNHALGIWTCSQVAWQFRVISPRSCICKIPWPNGISKLDREFPSRNLRKSEESRARIAVDQEIEAT